MIVNDKVGRMWMEVVKVYCKVLSKHLHRGTGENQKSSVRVSGLCVKNETQTSEI
jgi:hypothetical protein